MANKTELDELLPVLKNQHINFHNSDVIIKQRKRGLGEKPPLYLWDLTRSCYISSLRYLGNNIFQFDEKARTKIIGVYLLIYENGLLSVQEQDLEDIA